MPLLSSQVTPGFKKMFPRCAALDLFPVSTAPGVEHPGFDVDDVEARLGTARFNNFFKALISGKPYSQTVFSCGHRTNKAGVEVHCIYASDLEAFLASGG